MMRRAPEVTVYLCVAPVDMRKQAASLALLVEQSLGHNVFDASLYVFTNRKRDRVRIVYWERNGLCLWSKRVEKQQFIWPRLISGEAVAMTPACDTPAHAGAVLKHRRSSADRAA